MIKQDEQLVKLAAHTLIGEDQNQQAVIDTLSLLAQWKNKIFVKELNDLLTTEGDIDKQIRRYIKKYEDRPALYDRSLCREWCRGDDARNPAL